MSEPENPDAFPFEGRFLECPDGRIHYVDEGSGSPVLLVHGTPTWSYLYRHLIRGLSATHRVIAVDHLGFGRSDKPEQAPLRPADHARRLEALIDHLGLREVTLVVHDFGVPIGLAHAVARPGNVGAIVLFNGWMWSLAGDPAVERASRVLGGPVGRFLYKRLNVSPRLLIPAMMGDRSKLSREAHRRYVGAFPRASDRHAPWVLAGELIGSSAWYEQLWSARERIREIPALILWGMKDRAFGSDALERWEALFARGSTVRFPDAGHFVQEEEGRALVPTIEAFLGEHGSRAPHTA